MSDGFVSLYASKQLLNFICVDRIRKLVEAHDQRIVKAYVVTILEIGRYAVQKYQPSGVKIKVGGMIIKIMDNIAILSDGINTKGFLLSQLVPLTKHRSREGGVTLHV